MRFIKKAMSLILILLIVFCSLNSSFAVEVQRNNSLYKKVTEDFEKTIAKMSEYETLPVYLWCEDVNQKEIDNKTQEVVRITDDKE